MFRRIFRVGAHTRGFSNRVMYFDMQSTTPLDPRVVDAMIPYITDHFGNPSSRTHVLGKQAEAAVERARGYVAELIRAQPQEIVFTSGATESNNIAIKSAARFATMTDPTKKKKNRIITTQIEHKCVLDSFRSLQQDGWDPVYIKPATSGIVHVEQIAKEITPETLLVSVMAVNNEIGTVQRVKEIGELCRSKGVLFHTDAAQAVGKIDIDVNRDHIDMLSMSAHKLYGPKGIGALYVRRKPRVRLSSIVSGGGQERGIRSGTLATHQIVGFGEACRIAAAESQADHEHIKKLYDLMLFRVTSELSHVTLNGSPTDRWIGNLNLSFAAVEGEALMAMLENTAVSSGSACTSNSLEPSYVLRALDVKDELAHTSLRFGIGKFTTEEEVHKVCDKLIHSVNTLREMSPLWELIQEGVDLSTIKWGH